MGEYGFGERYMEHAGVQFPEIAAEGQVPEGQTLPAREKAVAWQDNGDALVLHAAGPTAESVAKALLKAGRKLAPGATSILMTVEYCGEPGDPFQGSATVMPA